MNELKLEKCCRTCLRNKRFNQMKFLSTKWTDALSFADMLVDITKMPKEIASPESLLKICSTCEQDLITAYNFRIVCQNTEQILADRLTQKITVVPPIEEIKLEDYHQDGILADNGDMEVKVETVIAEESNPTELCEVLSPPPKKSAKKRIRKPPNQPNDKKRKKPERRPNVRILESTDNINDDGSTDKSSEQQPKKKRSRKNRKPSLYCKRCDIKYETNKEYMRHCQEVMKSRVCVIKRETAPIEHRNFLSYIGTLVFLSMYNMR